MNSQACPTVVARLETPPNGGEAIQKFREDLLSVLRNPLLPQFSNLHVQPQLVPSVPSTSVATPAPNVASNIELLKYLIANTTLKSPIGDLVTPEPSMLALSLPGETGVPFTLTPQEIQLEAMRTAFLINREKMGGMGGLASKLADIFGFSGEHSWVPVSFMRLTFCPNFFIDLYRASLSRRSMSSPKTTSRPSICLVPRVFIRIR